MERSTIEIVDLPMKIAGSCQFVMQEFTSEHSVELSGAYSGKKYPHPMVIPCYTMLYHVIPATLTALPSHDGGMTGAPHGTYMG